MTTPGRDDELAAAGSAISGQLALLRARETTVVECVELALRRIEQQQPRLHAFLAVAGEAAIRDAEALDAQLAPDAAQVPRLAGIPIAVKDVHDTEGIPTTNGLRCLADRVPAHDCAVVSRLRGAGGVVVGKTNTPALGLLAEVKNSLGPDSRNPWDLERTPGGSSGGSAAAVASGAVAAATGTDSAGSITAPASFCGIYGMKPTHGLVPTWPVGPDSLLANDSGPMTASVADAALMLEATAGFDARDPVSLRGAPPDVVGAVLDARRNDKPLRGIRIALSLDLGHFDVDPDVRSSVLEAAEAFAELGATVEEATPRFDDPFQVYAPIYASNLRVVLAALPQEAAEELFPETVGGLDSVPAMSAEAYVAAFNGLLRFRALAAAFFETYDLLLTPATSVPAFKLRELPAGKHPERPPWAGVMPFSMAWNMTGQPTASVPASLTPEGLPVGVMLVGRHRDDHVVMHAASAFEMARPWPAQARPATAHTEVRI